MGLNRSKIQKKTNDKMVELIQIKLPKITEREKNEIIPE